MTAAQKPVVSAIIPTHNRPQLLARAIQSVIAQTFTDWELIVVQNGRTRKSEAVVLSFNEPRIRYLYELQAGAVNARNMGIRASQGKYVAFLDDDDEWLPEKLARQVAILDQRPEISLVGCRALRMNADGQVFDEAADFRGEPTFRAFVAEWGIIIHSLSAVLIRRTAFDAVGLFDPAYLIANDYDLYLRLSRRFRCVSIQEPFFRYRRHAGPMGNLSNQRERMVEEVIAILNKTQPSRTLGVSRRTIGERIAKFHYLRASDCLDVGEVRQAAGAFAQAVRHDPLIGSKMGWGRSAHRSYQILKPYLAIVYCLVRGLRVGKSSQDVVASRG